LPKKVRVTNDAEAKEPEWMRAEPRPTVKKKERPAAKKRNQRGNRKATGPLRNEGHLEYPERGKNKGCGAVQ